MPDSKPIDLEQQTGVSAAAAGEERPSMEPPAAVSATAEGAATAWFNNKKVNALWCINQNRNSYVSIAGVGWRKLANNSDTAVVALTMLAGAARLSQGPVNYRQEADNMIHEMYVW